MNAAEIQRLVDQLRAHVQRQRDALALEIVAELQRKPPDGTPVLTGYARASWVPILGQPSLTIARPPLTGTKRQRQTAGQALAVDQRARQQAAIAMLLAQGPAQPTASAHVYNPAVYVNKLNTQTRHRGFVEASVGRAIIARRVAIAELEAVIR